MEPCILVVNDDGFDSPDLWHLVTAVADLGRVAVVAPHAPQSWTGQSHRSTSLDMPPTHVRVHERQWRTSVPEAVGAWSVEGTPARTVRTALDALGVVPALVVSGINDDWNCGAVIGCSGTIGAAREAALSGVPAIAFSKHAATNLDQSPAHQHHVTAIVRRVLTSGLPDDTAVLNVNFPAHVDHNTTWVTTRTSTLSPYEHHTELVTSTAEGVSVFMVGNADQNDRSDTTVEPDSDMAALANGHISLTFLPAHLGLTHHRWKRV